MATSTRSRPPHARGSREGLRVAPWVCSPASSSASHRPRRLQPCRALGLVVGPSAAGAGDVILAFVRSSSSRSATASSTGAEPDCGTKFNWATKAFGATGWLGVGRSSLPTCW